MVYNRDSSYFGKTPVATRDSWKREPPEGPFDAYDLVWTFAQEDLERIRWGLIPRAMEEKWVAYVDVEELFLHRSWTGILCYILRLTSVGIDQIRIAREMPNHEWQITLARWLVESKLIGRDWELPRSGP
jgi:hypothetical protein